MSILKRAFKLMQLHAPTPNAQTARACIMRLNLFNGLTS
jgi:hypothetical protein